MNDLKNLPPHLAPFFNMMANAQQQRPMGANPPESEAAFINDMLKNQFMNNMNSMHMQQLQQQDGKASTSAEISLYREPNSRTGQKKHRRKPTSTFYATKHERHGQQHQKQWS